MKKNTKKALIIIATISTLITMCAVEYKDKAHGGLFDWKDIFAGMFPAICIDILCVILMICKWWIGC